MSGRIEEGMSENWTDRLSEYLDGELSDDDAVALEARLAEDAELASEAWFVIAPAPEIFELVGVLVVEV